MRSSILLIAGAAGLASSSSISTRQTNSTTAQSWDEIQPSADLKYEPCFDKYTCARLIVPLDYTNTSAGTTVIAYLKQAATVDPENAEDILINPGGPGNSGVLELLSLGPLLAQVLGPQYNLVGFDPRAVNNSGLTLTCFGNDTQSKMAEAIYLPQFSRPVDGMSEYSLRHEYEAAIAYAKWCSNFNENTDGKYANTVAVASDMKNYIEKAALYKGEDADEAKLNYYGVSYGSVLGAVYGSLFPSHVGKIVLDGVIDAQDYYTGTYSSNLQTVDGAINDFFYFCHAAGPERCAFWSNSTEAIANRTRAVLEAIREAPVPVYDTAIVQYPTLITYEDVDLFFLTSMYSPLSQWPVVAQILAEIETRNGTTAAQYLQAVNPTMVNEAFLISGIDSVYNDRQAVSTYEKWTEHLAYMTKQSDWVADAWAAVALVVKDLAIYPPRSQQFNGTAFNVTTNAPILFVSNTHDPSAPLPGAQKMHSLFPGSGFLMQEAPGHIASQSAVSNCTYGYIGNYFATGELPPANTTCQVESVPFITQA